MTLSLIGGEVDVREQMNEIIRAEHQELNSVRAAQHAWAQFVVRCACE